MNQTQLLFHPVVRKARCVKVRAFYVIWETNAKFTLKVQKPNF